MTSAMLAAKKGRAAQLALLDEYMAGKPTEFKSHQGKGGDSYSYDPAVYSKDRAPIKIKMDMKYVFLDAAAQCDEKSVQALLEGAEKIDADTANADGLTALHQAAIENSMKCASILVQNKATVDAKDNDWWTPLHAAAACGHWRVMNFLISSGADVCAVNADGELPLDIVEGKKSKQILEGEYKRLGMDDAALEVCRNGGGAVLQKVLDQMYEQKVSLEAKDVKGATLLHAAASNGFEKVVKFLVEEKVNLNLGDNDRDTALHLAVFFQHYTVVEILGAAHADMEPLNRFGETPMFLADQLGEDGEGDETMKRLLKALIAKEKADAVPGAERRPRLNTKGGSVKRKSMAEKEAGKKGDAKAMLEQAKAHAAGGGGEEVIYAGDGEEGEGENGDGDISDLYAQPSKDGKKKHSSGARHEPKKGARPSMVGGALIGSGDRAADLEMAPDKDAKGGGCCVIA